MPPIYYNPYLFVLLIGVIIFVTCLIKLVREFKLHQENSQSEEYRITTWLWAWNLQALQILLVLFGLGLVVFSLNQMVPF